MIKVIEILSCSYLLVSDRYKETEHTSLMVKAIEICPFFASLYLTRTQESIFFVRLLGEFKYCRKAHSL